MGYSGGRQPEIGSEPGVGSVNRKGSVVGVGGASYGTRGGAAKSGAAAGVGLSLLKGEQEERMRRMKIIALFRAAKRQYDLFTKCEIALSLFDFAPLRSEFLAVTDKSDFMESPSAEWQWVGEL
jgi:hypothetical protein